MPTVVGIRFKKACKIYYFDPAESGVVKGDHAIVETARGVEYLLLTQTEVNTIAISPVGRTTTIKAI